MLKKLITYTDFNGKQQTEACYFNMTKTELTSLELETEGGFADYIMKTIECRNDKNNKELAKLVKKLVLMSYGEKSEDGKKFRKSEEILKDFEASAAFDEYFSILLSDENALLEFFKGIMPVMTKEQEKQIDEEVNRLLKERSDVTDQN